MDATDSAVLLDYTSTLQRLERPVATIVPISAAESLFMQGLKQSVLRAGQRADLPPLGR